MLRLFQSTGGWAAIFLLSCSALFADVTLRYKTEIKMNPTLSPQLAEMATKGMGGFVPSESSLLFKGGKTYSSQGAITSIADFNKQEIVLLDSAGRRYSTLPLNQLADEFAKGMPAMPPEARAAMSSIKTAVESKSTGRSAEIQGVQTEEKEVVLTMEGPAMPNMPAGPLMRMVMQIWTPKSGEAMRVPAIREISGYNLASLAMMNPGAAMEKMLQQMPGSSDFGNFVKEMRNFGVILRMHSNVYMPGIAAMMKAMPAGDSPFGAGFDADAPFIQMQMEVAELSTTPIADSLFAVPEEYKSAPVADLVKDMLMKSRAPTAAK